MLHNQILASYLLKQYVESINEQDKPYPYIDITEFEIVAIDNDKKQLVIDWCGIVNLSRKGEGDTVIRLQESNFRRHLERHQFKEAVDYITAIKRLAPIVVEEVTEDDDKDAEQQVLNNNQSDMDINVSALVICSEAAFFNVTGNDHWLFSISADVLINYFSDQLKPVCSFLRGPMRDVSPDILDPYTQIANALLIANIFISDAQLTQVTEGKLQCVTAEAFNNMYIAKAVWEDYRGWAPRWWSSVVETVDIEQHALIVRDMMGKQNTIRLSDLCQYRLVQSPDRWSQRMVLLLIGRMGCAQNLAVMTTLMEYETSLPQDLAVLIMTFRPPQLLSDYLEQYSPESKDLSIERELAYYSTAEIEFGMSIFTQEGQAFLQDLRHQYL